MPLAFQNIFWSDKAIYVSSTSLKDSSKIRNLQLPMGGGAWWAAVSGVTQSRTRLTCLSSSSSSILYLIRYTDPNADPGL